MAVIVFSGNETRLLLHWSGLAHRGGHDSMLLEPVSLIGKTLEAAEICFYDLGPHAEPDLQPFLEAIQHASHVRFVAMSARPTAQQGLELLKAGAKGYCNRLLSDNVLGAVITSVNNGEIWAGRQVTDYLITASLGSQEGNEAERGVLDRLTDREADIANQVAAGSSNKVIAAESGISERTVKAHLNAIFRKTGVSNRVQLALAISHEQDQLRQQSNG